jgi:anti-anti-sigma factor
VSASNDLEIDLVRVSDHCVALVLTGVVDAAHADRLDDGFVSATAVAHVPDEIIIDLSNVTYVDSAGLSALVRNRRRIDPAVAIMIQNPNDHVRRLLHITALDALFPTERERQPDEHTRITCLDRPLSDEGLSYGA